MKIVTLIGFSYEKLFFFMRPTKSRIKFDKPKQIIKHEIPMKTVDIRENLVSPHNIENNDEHV